MKELDWTRYDVLVVDDEPDNLDAFRFAFRKSFRLHYALGAEQALGELTSLQPAVIVADQRMPKMSGIELLGRARERFPDTYAILLTAYADLEVLIDAVNSGAVDRYVQKPWDSKELSIILRQGITSYATLLDNRRMREQLAQYAGFLDKQQHNPIDFGEIVGGSAAARAVLEQVAEVAASSSPVLIEGETGLEKDVVARAVHVGSPRETRPFVRVTCAAFPADELERELFGYAKGSFEGAFRDRPGRVELADGGTLFLNEPHALGASLQARLLRLLNEGVTERVGEPLERRVDVRLIVAVTPTLGEWLKDREPSNELAARLTVYPIHLRPLRERVEDVAALSAHFLTKYGERNARAATSISADALEQLRGYDWPGNVRELENVIERAAILAHGSEIQTRHLSFRDGDAGRARARAPLAASPGASGEGLTLTGRLDAIEKGELIRALEVHGGNKAEVARALGIHRTTLYYRLKRLGIDA